MVIVRSVALAAAAASLLVCAASAAPADNPPAPAPAPVSTKPRPILGKVKVAQVARGQMGGGFIEFVFGGGSERKSDAYAPSYAAPFYAERASYGRNGPRYMVDDEDAPSYGRGAARAMPRDDARSLDPRYLPQTVTYGGKETAGTIIVDTPNRFLYLVQDGGKALRYGIGVGRPGFTWAGVKTVSMKREWPDWRPPEDMLRRRPDLPRYMPGGPDNPLGARALYLGSSLYRIHGSNEPWTIGTAVSSGCIRMRNEDVADLYRRVSIGTKVVVM